MIPENFPILFFIGGALIIIYGQLHRIADALEERNRQEQATVSMEVKA